MAGQSGNDTDQAMTEKKTLDATVKAKIKEYTNTYDSRLLRAFKQDFNKWTLNNFNTVSVTELGKLDNEAEKLYTLLSTEKYRPWTKEEVIRHLRRGNTIESKVLNDQFETVINTYNQPSNYGTNEAQNQTGEGPLTRSRSQQQIQYLSPPATRHDTPQDQSQWVQIEPEPSNEVQQAPNLAIFAPST
ncbi:hypothetical protein TSTA_052810 [Talaromyces stipitatus ATCC 10500]|uniref:Uncharacterized protein n=1 Tax=Talaromyces stipitatus (strain ATCC 10500 / CBS 375.48 / QM 6759 / NRRL 1006) TaxID=441959 RepID=B8MPV2_TALSN|nr:uncharacterized protein TSTA_052810 [Talaromyces stipitatus ATCC 10500]EED12760.1 hypothetical protein TSTA_052810 [Talaromyces stipitatus ATCC 10500]